MAIKSKHGPVHIDAATYEQMKAYSEKSGVPVTRVVAVALKEWLATMGAARLQALTKR
jgi:hypothetical protein